jgi:hypothetical protein
MNEVGENDPLISPFGPSAPSATSASGHTENETTFSDPSFEPVDLTY